MTSLIITISSAAFHPQLQLLQSLQRPIGMPVVAPVQLMPVQRPRTWAVMFDGVPEEPDDEDAWAEIDAELSPLQKQLKRLNPIAFGGAVNTVTVLSALFAWFITPPMGRVAALGSLAVGSAGGLKAGKVMREARRGLVPSAIADMVRERGLSELRPKEVARLAERYSVNPVEFEKQLSAVYARYLRQLLSESEGQAVPAQVRELGMLRRGIGLRWNATEAAHVAEVTSFLDGEAPPSDASELPAELSALLWLSSSLFATSKGSANLDAVQASLVTDPVSAQRKINAMSKPIYQKAVTQAVGKYNRTEAPEVLQTVRQALCLTEAAASQVHTEIYNAQLSVLLNEDGGEATLGEEEMELLGELEGMLQVRGAAGALRRLTEPLYNQDAAAAVAAAFDSGGAESPISMWGKLAVRQQQLRLPTETAKATLICESRRLAASRLTSAAELLTRGQEAEAVAEVTRVVEYSEYLGEMLAVSGLGLGDSAANLAARYMGALTVGDDATTDSAVALAAAAASAAAADDATASLTSALFSLSDPALASVRKEYAASLDGIVSGGAFSDAESQTHQALAASLGVPSALAQRLSVDAYYGWLLDASERGNSKALEGTEQVRECLCVDSAAVTELYANTAIDELVISACCEKALEAESPLTASAVNGLAYIEGQLAARPGVLATVVAAASAE